MKKYKFILLSNTTGKRLELTNAPLGWDSQKLSMIRDSLYFGVYTALSAELSFIFEGYEFLKKEYARDGIDFDVLLRIYQVKDNHFLYEAKINSNGFKLDEKLKIFKCDLIESSFVQLFKNREKTKFNIFNTRTIDGHEVTLPTVNATLRPKILKYYSETENMEGENLYSHSLPFNLKINDNPQVKSGYQVFYGVPPIPLSDAAFYVNQKLTVQEIDYSLDISLRAFWRGATGLNQSFYMDNAFYQFDLLQKNLNDEIVATIARSGKREWRSNKTWSANYSGKITLSPGDYLTAFMYIFPLPGYEIGINYDNLILKIKEDSTYPDTTCKCILPFELFDNLLFQMTGQRNSLISKTFGRTDLGYSEDGKQALQSVTKGTLLRGKDDKVLATSFADAFKSYNVKGNLGILIKGNKIYVDPKEELFANTLLDLGEVSEMVINPAEDFYFNSLKIGYLPQKYEELNGSDEFNTTSVFTNRHSIYQKKLDLISPIRADGTGIELSRRLQVAVDKGSPDYRNDNDLFFINLIRTSEGFTNQRDENIYASGVLSPDTAYNLSLCPSQCLIEWKKYLAVPLSKDKRVYKYQSKEFNSSLEVDTGNNYSRESTNFDAGSQQLFMPEILNCKLHMTTDLINMLQADPLAIIKVKNNGSSFYGYLYEVVGEANEVGNLKLLAVNRKLVDLDKKIKVLKVDQTDYLEVDDNNSLMIVE